MTPTPQPPDTFNHHLPSLLTITKMHVNKDPTRKTKSGNEAEGSEVKPSQNDGVWGSCLQFLW